MLLEYILHATDLFSSGTVHIKVHTNRTEDL
jgi:hypothetical protein